MLLEAHVVHRFMVSFQNFFKIYFSYTLKSSVMLRKLMDDKWITAQVKQSS